MQFWHLHVAGIPLMPSSMSIVVLLRSSSSETMTYIQSRKLGRHQYKELLKDNSGIFLDGVMT